MSREKEAENKSSSHKEANGENCFEEKEEDDFLLVDGDGSFQCRKRRRR